MRRNEKEISDRKTLEQIIHIAKVCRLALQAEPVPYLVPLNYGYAEGALYFHSAPTGRKLDLMRQNPRAAFEISLDLGIVEAEQACGWSASFQSVIGHGRIEFLEDPAEKRYGLDTLMAQYAEGEFSYPDATLEKTCVYRLVIEAMTGKQSRV